MASDELVTEIKKIIHNLCVSGGAISRETLISISNGVLSSRFPEKLSKTSRSMTLTTEWAQAKRELNPALYEDLTLTWKKKIANAIFEHSIHKEKILIRRHLVLLCPTKQPSLKKVLNQCRLPMSMISAK